MTERDALRRLQDVLSHTPRLAVAVSGGVDSMTLAHIAHRTVDVLMVHALSPAVPPEATARVRAHAETHGWELLTTATGEFDDERYLTNPVNRCYFCKVNLYDRIAHLTDRPIASGANLDDLGDYRPGLVAAGERGAFHPLVDAGIGKAEIRALASRLGLDDLAELPAQPCLASRVETGIAIDSGDLVFVDAVEKKARQLAPGLADIRCRILNHGVVLELDDPAAPGASEAAWAARQMTLDSGRQWAGTARYRRGSAFVGVTGT